MPFDDLRVDGDALAGADFNDLSDGDVARIRVANRAVVADQMRDVGADVHQRADRSAGFAHGALLEVFADLIENHDGGCLGVFADEERADGGDAHQKVLVKHFAVEDVDDRLRQNVAARQKRGHAAEDRIDNPRVLKDEPRDAEHDERNRRADDLFMFAEFPHELLHRLSLSSG